jgi:hypothetical protein
MRPCWTRASAIAAPIPELAPVTTATLPTHLSIERTILQMSVNFQQVFITVALNVINLSVLVRF